MPRNEGIFKTRDKYDVDDHYEKWDSMRRVAGDKIDLQNNVQISED